MIITLITSWRATKIENHFSHLIFERHFVKHYSFYMDRPIFLNFTPIAFFFQDLYFNNSKINNWSMNCWLMRPRRVLTFLWVALYLFFYLFFSLSTFFLSISLSFSVSWFFLRKKKSQTWHHLCDLCKN